MSRLVRGILTGLIALAISSPLWGQQDPGSRFHGANEAYAAGRYEDAARTYAELIRLGIEDPRLEYNLANARFKTGRIGEAILHWERARRLAPADPDVRRNLAYARTLIRDRAALPDPAGVVATVVAFQDRVGPGAQAIAALVVWWMVALLVAYAASRRGGWTPRVGWTLAVLVLILASVSASWWWTWERIEGRPLAVVLDETAQVRAGPGENNATLLAVHEGLTVRVRQERDGWVQVSLPDGLSGWIRRDAVGRV